jgi:hypothetical protein
MGIGMQALRLAAQYDVPRPDLERASGGHRVARIGDEVEQHLLELAGIHSGGAQMLAELGGDLDVLAHQPAHQRLERRDGRVEIDHRGHHHLSPRVRKKLRGERGRPARGLLDLPEILV